MIIPGLPKGLQNQLQAKLEESFEMFVDKCIRLHNESQSPLPFAEWWTTYKEEKGYKNAKKVRKTR